MPLDRREFLRAAAASTIALPAAVRASCLSSVYDSADVHIAVDFFRHTMPSAGCADLWLILRPQVLYLPSCDTNDDGFARYIQALDSKDQKLRYALWTLDEEYARTLRAIHVSLPATVGVEIRLLDEKDAVVGAPITANRASLLRILNWLRFSEDNYAPIAGPAAQHHFKLEGDQWTEFDGKRPDDLGRLVTGKAGFPAFFDAALVGHYNMSPKKRSREVTADWLDLQLAHGTRRRVRAETVQGSTTQPDLVMTLERADKGPLVTNIHSLLGLTYRIGRIDRADLASVRDIEIVLKPHNDDAVSLKLSSGPEPDFVAGFFSSLTCANDAVALKATWDPEDNVGNAYAQNSLRRTIFVQQSSRPFAPALSATKQEKKAGSVTFVLVPREGGLAAATEAPSLRQLRITDARDDTTDPPFTGGKVECFRSFRVKLEPYRQFNADQPAGANQRLVRLLPNREDADAFWDEWRKLMRAGNPRASAASPLQGALDAAVLPLLVESRFPRMKLGSDRAQSPAQFQWIGCFNFPWDRTNRDFTGTNAQPTILLLLNAREVVAGSAIFDEEMILFAARGAVQLTPERSEGEQERTTYIAKAPDSALDITAIELKLPVDELGRPLVIPVAQYENEFDFELAQSAGVSTVRLTVDYAEACQSVTSNFADDIANHVALNVYRSGADSLHLNPDRENYPWKQDGADHQACAINSQYRMQLRWQTEPDRSDLTWMKMRQIALSAYDLAATGERRFEFKVEGTYGTELPITVAADGKAIEVSTAADWPTAHAADVMREEGNSGSSGPTLPLLFVRPGDGSLELCLDGDCLVTKGGETDPQRGARLWRAWRSVAELAHAGRISIEIESFRFNFRTALTAAPDNALIIDGVVAEPAAAELKEDVTQSVRNRVNSLLTEDPIPSSAALHTITLSEDFRQRAHFYTACVMIERSTPVRPAPDVAPAQWKFLAPVRGVEDRVVDLSTQIAPSRAAEEFLTARVQVARLLKPGVAQAGRQLAMQQLVGSRTNRTVQRASDPQQRRMEEMIVPVGIATPDEGSAGVSCIALSFRHPARIEMFRDASYRGLRQTVSALECVMSGPVAGSPGLNPVELSKMFTGLAKESASVMGLLEDLSDLVVPVHNPAKVSGDGPGAEAFRASLEGLSNPDSALRKALKAELFERLLQNPTAYRDAKAFLWIGLTDRANRLPNDAARLRITKRQSTSSAAWSDDKDDFPFSDWVRAEWQEGDQKREALGALDMLDDVSYMNRFKFANVAIDRLEGLLEPNVNAAADISKVQVAVSSVQLSTGPWDPARAALSETVQLPSREPVTAGALMSISTDMRKAPAHPSRIVRKVLLADARLDARDDGDLELVAQYSAPSPIKDKQWDERKFTVVFSIEGDEEIDPKESLANDLFQLELTSAVPAAQEEEKKDPSTAIDQFLIATDFGKIDNYPDLLFGTILPRLAKEPVRAAEVVAAQEQPPAPVVDRQNKVLAHRLEFCVSKANIEISGPVDLETRRPWLRRLSLYGPRTTGQRSRLFIVLSVSLPVWKMWAISVRQLRNKAKCVDARPVDAGFIDDFLSTGRELSATMPLSRPVIENLDAEPPASLGGLGRQIRLSRLLQSAFTEANLLTGDPASQRHNVSLTLSYIQRSAMATFVVSEERLDIQHQADKRAEYMPVDAGVYLRDASTDPKAAEPTIAFPDDADEFALDVEWREPSTSRLVMRLTNRAVTLIQ